MNKKVDPKCVNASNPYHVCGEHCIGKTAESGRHEGRRSPLALLSRRSSSSSSGGGNSIKMRENRMEDFRRANGSIPPHEYTNHHEDSHRASNLSVPGGDDSKLGEDKKVDPSSSNFSFHDHPSASNGSHEHANHHKDPPHKTIQSVPGTPGGSDAKFGEDKKVDPSSSNFSFHDHPSASNASHERANHHKDPPQETMLSVLGTPGGIVKLGENKKVDPSSSNSFHEHPSASNPSHELVNHHTDLPHEAIRSVPGTPGGDDAKLGKDKKVDPGGSSTAHEHPSAFNHHKYSPQEPIQLVPGTPGRGDAKLGEDKKVDPSSSGTSHEHPSASNPSHEHANHHKDPPQGTIQSVSGAPGTYDAKLGEDKVDPSSFSTSQEHPDASKPSHERANHHKDPPQKTIRSVPGMPVHNGMKNGKYNLHENLSEASSSTSVGLKIGESRKVDPKCVNASNPYHVCAGYCSKSSNAMVQSPRDNSGSGGRRNKAAVATVERNVLPAVATVERRSVLPAVATEERRSVLPGCVNATNPYHKCGDYCKKKTNNS